MAATATPAATPNRREELADAVLRVGMARGLDHVSVREVAAEAGCSIGTVQHYFRTKDEMLVFAFRRVVERTMARALRVDKGGGVRPALRGILAQLLPLDDERRAEAAVHLAFATRAAVEPTLAEVQAETLATVRAELAYLLGAAREEGGRRADDRVHDDAVRLLALVDGLALHAVSAPGQLSPDALLDAVESFLDGVLDRS